MFRALKPGDLCAKNRNGNLPLPRERKLTKHSYIHVYIPGFYSIILTNEIQKKKTDLANQKLPGSIFIY